MKKKRASAALVGILLSLVLLAAATPAPADGGQIIGMVRVTASGTVNLRAAPTTASSILARGYPGDIFQSRGLSSDFYEIVLSDGRTAFVHANLVAFTSLSTPTPAWSGQFAATLPVYYRSSLGAILYTDYVQCVYGANAIYANDARVPAGYALTGQRRVDVYVSANRIATPSFVTFIYVAPAATAAPTQMPQQYADVPVYYKDLYGALLNTGHVYLAPGSRLVTPDPSMVPYGYTLVWPADVVVSVSVYGAATPSSVTFLYTRSIPATATPGPVSVTIPVYYVDNLGTRLATAYATCQAGSCTVSAQGAYVPAGYVPTSPQSVTVYVSPGGAASPASVTFYYTRQATPAPVSITVPVYYVDNNGTRLATAYAVCRAGSNTVSAQGAYVPAGYVPTSPQSVTVYVSPGGAASPSSVTFNYMRQATPTPAAKATVPVYYRSDSGALLYTDYKLCGYGLSTIYADDARVPQGYRLTGSRTANVTVDAYGRANPSSVTFTYQASVSVVLPVTYRDASGGHLNTEYLTLGQGTHTVTANDSKTPAGYTLSGSRSVQVYVSGNGTASPSSVVFVYQAPRPPISVYVPVVYRAQNGTQFAALNALCSSAAPNRVTADSSLVPDGYVLSSSSVVTVTVSQDGIASPSMVEFICREATAADAISRLSDYQKTRLNSGTHSVYSGPGTEYYRAGSARVGGGTCRVYGAQGDWALIGYGLSGGGYRIGYVKKSVVPSSVPVPELQFGYAQMTINGDATFTDDPIISPTGGSMAKLRNGDKIYVLAYMGDNDHWAYVEIPGFRDGKTARGFVARSKLR